MRGLFKKLLSIGNRTGSSFNVVEQSKLIDLNKDLDAFASALEDLIGKGEVIVTFSSYVGDFTVSQIDWQEARECIVEKRLLDVYADDEEISITDHRGNTKRTTSFTCCKANVQKLKGMLEFAVNKTKDVKTDLNRDMIFSKYGVAPEEFLLAKNKVKASSELKAVTSKIKWMK